MSRDDVTVFVSDSISDRVDMDQFYDHPDVKDVIVNIVSCGMTLSGKMSSFKLDTSWSPHLNVSFISTADNVSDMMFSTSIEKLSFMTKPGSQEIRSFDNVEMISRKFDIDRGNNQCLYEFIFEIHNI